MIHIKNNKSKLSAYTAYIVGVLSGLLNGLFGAGGGIASVFLLKKSGFDQKKAHATSIAVILPLSILSGAFYLFRGNFKLTDALIFLPGGIIGAIFGSLYLKRISVTWLRRIFGILIIWASIKLIF